MDTHAAKKLENIFPNLHGTKYAIASPCTPQYNCVAFVVGDESLRWDHLPNMLSYWPRRVRRDGSIESLIDALRTRGFQPCDHGNPETGFDKIALYGSDGQWKHVAKQLSDGTWASKLGNLFDITHDTLDALICESYGSVVCYVKRPSSKP